MRLPVAFVNADARGGGGVCRVWIEEDGDGLGVPSGEGSFGRGGERHGGAGKEVAAKSGEERIAPGRGMW